MTKAVIVAVMFAGAAFAAPTYAQSWDAHWGCEGRRAHELEAWLAHDVREGRINWREGRDLHAKIDWVERLEARACQYGADDRDAGDIANHYERIAEEIRTAERGYRADDW